ncbi:MAG: SRPBCC family protein, partial [Nitriliruptorales bacterium]|nr:SRPBCC family protein [Nitriliruptorales bacterium]
MTAVVESIEIARPAEEVFAYVTDLPRLPEWQDNVVRACVDGGEMPEVGARCTLTRRIAGAEREITSEVTALIPPTRWAIRGVEGPMRAVVNGRVDAL